MKPQFTSTSNQTSTVTNHQGRTSIQKQQRFGYAHGAEATPPKPQLVALQPYRERRDRQQQQSSEAKSRQAPTRLRQQQRIKNRRRAQIWETTIAASFMIVWTAVALSGVARLRPVQQGTHHSLETLTSEVEQLEARVNRARRKVELGLDPTQSETAIRESLNYVPFNQLGVVFEEPAPGE